MTKVNIKRLVPVAEIENLRHARMVVKEMGFETDEAFLKATMVKVKELVGKWTECDEDEPVNLPVKKVPTSGNFFLLMGGQGICRVFFTEAPLYRDGNGRLFMRDQDIY